MKLIVGLGNPGEEYVGTRHNVGFMVIDSYLGNVKYKEKFSAQYYEIGNNNDKVIFLKPMTFMNNSGEAVRKFVDYYKVNVEDVLIIYDDMDFEVGEFKIKKNGSAAGHNGVKSIIGHLNTEEIKRIRIGISREKEDKVNYVLGKFSKTDQEKLIKVIETVKNIIDDFLVMDFEKLMCKYN